MDLFAIARSFGSAALSSNKAVLMFLVVVVLLYLAFDATESKFYSNSGNKIELLNKITELRQNQSVDSVTRGYLNTLELRIIGKKSLYDNLIDYITSIIYPSHKSFIADKRNPFIHFITSSWICILCILVIPLSKNNPAKNMIQQMFSNGLVFIMLIILAVVNSYIFNLIPVMKFPFVNYTINVVLEMVIWWCIKKVYSYSLVPQLDTSA